MEKLILGVALLILSLLSFLQYYKTRKKYYTEKQEVNAGAKRVLYFGFFSILIGVILIIMFFSEGT